MRKYLLVFFAGVLLLGGAYFAPQFFGDGLKRYSPIWVASADDEEDEEDEDEEDEEDEEEEEKKYRTETVVVEPARTVTKTEMRTFILADSDRDGIADESDPYPQLASIYMANDGDGDGISDELEEIADSLSL